MRSPFARLVTALGRRASAGAHEPEQSVRISFDADGLDAHLPAYFELCERLEAAVSAAGVGEVDGPDETEVYAYGPDAEALFAVMGPLLRAFPARPCEVELRHGDLDDEDAATRVVQL